MSSVRVCHLQDEKAFCAFREGFAAERPELRFGRLAVPGGEAVLRSELGGLKLFWIYEGEGEVSLPDGFRTKEGDGHRLPRNTFPNRWTRTSVSASSFCRTRSTVLCPRRKVPFSPF